MQSISDEALIEVYFTALKLELDDDFIDLIYKEITARGLSTMVVNAEE